MIVFDFFLYFKLGNFREFSIMVKFSEFNPLKLIFWSLKAEGKEPEEIPPFWNGKAR